MKETREIGSAPKELLFVNLANKSTMDAILYGENRKQVRERIHTEIGRYTHKQREELVKDIFKGFSSSNPLWDSTRRLDTAVVILSQVNLLDLDIEKIVEDYRGAVETVFSFEERDKRFERVRVLLDSLEIVGRFVSIAVFKSRFKQIWGEMVRTATMENEDVRYIHERMESIQAKLQMFNQDKNARPVKKYDIKVRDWYRGGLSETEIAIVFGLTIEQVRDSIARMELSADAH